MPGKSISNQINSNQKYKVKKVKSCQSNVIFFAESRYDRRVARAQMKSGKKGNAHNFRMKCFKLDPKV